MSGRETVYNKITTPEKIEKINPENRQLVSDFTDYLSSIDRSPKTIQQYTSDLNIFFVYNLDNNSNKPFEEITKRDLVRFQSHALNTWGWSPKRVRRVKAVISSLSNYIENILGDEPEYKDFRSIVQKIESPTNETVREKTVFTKEELTKLLDKLVADKKYKQACALSLAMNSGRRKGEIPLFKTEYFTEDNKILNGAMYKTSETVRTKGRGVRGKQLYLYTLSKDFEYYLNLWLKEREQLGIESIWLFPKRDEPNEHIEESTMNHWAEGFTDYLKEMQVNKEFYWHSMRHYFCTALSENNIPIEVIKQLVGHESSETTSIYIDTSAESSFDKYFGADGIKQVDNRSIQDL